MATPRTRKPQRSARDLFASTTLGLEALLVGFAALAAYGLRLAEPETIAATAAGLAVCCLVAAGLLRRHAAGYVLGTFAQLLLIASGLVVSMMYVIGVIFTILWFVALRLGAQIDVERLEREDGERDQQAGNAAP